MIDYKVSNNKGFWYIFIITDNFSIFLWAMPLKHKSSKTLTEEFSCILTTSKRSSFKLETDRGAEFSNSIFEFFLKSKNKQHYSRFTDNGPSMTERVIRNNYNWLKKPVFLAGKVSWINELSSVINNYNITIHSSIKMTPNQASEKSTEKEVSSNLQDRRVKQKPKYKSRQLFRTAYIKWVFSFGYSTNYSYKLYTVTEVIHDTIPTYRIDYIPESYNENLLSSTNLILDENNQVMRKLNLFQLFSY